MSEGEASQDAAPDQDGEMMRLRERLANAELRAEGAKHGMRDFDGLKMLDEADRLGAVDKDAAGKVIAKLRKEKPWLFTASTSPAARTPAAEPVTSVDAMKMSYEEWRTARAALLRRQGSAR